MNEKPKILVVDDEDYNRTAMVELLEHYDYKVEVAVNGSEGVELAESFMPDLILIDAVMPVMDGYEAVRHLKQNPKTALIPVIMVSGLSYTDDRIHALEAGVDDFLMKPVNKTELQTRTRTLLKVKAYNEQIVDYSAQLEKQVRERTKSLEKAMKAVESAYIDTIIRLTKASEYKDEDTGAHIQRMSYYAGAIARKLGLNHTIVKNITHAASMHDIGKIGIPDHILLKPGKLDKDEWEIMKSHTVIGAGILEGAKEGYLPLARIIALTHHEKWDGTGYPYGLKHKKIPLSGRIVAIADVFDALTSKRPYKKAFSIEKSHAIIREGRGTHFEPKVVDAFFAIQSEILEIKERFSNTQVSLLVKMVGDHLKKAPPMEN